MFRILFFILGAFGALGSVSAGPQLFVTDARLWKSPDGVQLVFGVSGAVAHRLDSPAGADRVVIEIDDARLRTTLQRLDFKGSAITAANALERKDGALVVVLELNRSATAKSILLKPNREYGYRILVDIAAPSRPSERSPAASAAPPRTTVSAPKSSSPRPVAAPFGGGAEFVIAIDAGHGGEDPGAKGARGTLEKDVTLDVARRLAALIDAASGMRAVLVREGDYYLKLQKRMALAREAKADAFVSIHADSTPNRSASGSSVYTVSTRGASSAAARWLADRENASDLIGGVSLDDKDETLASVLMDLTVTASMDASQRLAASILTELGRVGATHQPRVQHAGFMVLKAPDIPSILVETAFISNPREEKLLGDDKFRQKVASAVFAGLNRYLTSHAPRPVALHLAAADSGETRAYRVAKGDTLSKIALRYQTTVSELRKLNRLSGDRLVPGKMLQIPVIAQDT